MIYCSHIIFFFVGLWEEFFTSSYKISKSSAYEDFDKEVASIINHISVCISESRILRFKFYDGDFLLYKLEGIPVLSL